MDHLSRESVHGPLPEVSQSANRLEPPESGLGQRLGTAEAGSDRKSIVLVDDDPSFLRAFASLLEREGYRVETFDSAERALIRLERARSRVPGFDLPALLILDLHFEGMPGDDLVRDLRRREIDVPVVVLSGVIEEREVRSLGVPFFEKDTAPTVLPDYLKRNLGVLADIQELRNAAARIGVAESRVGKVVLFDSARGWGLLRVIGRSRPLYVNAADILDSGVEDESGDGAAPRADGGAQGSGSRKAFRYKELQVGQLVSFELNLESARGPRASRVAVIPSPWIAPFSVDERCAPRFSGN